MSQPPVRHVEITRPRRVRGLSWVLAAVGAVPLVISLASFVLEPNERALLALLAFAVGALFVSLALLLPPLIAWIARSRPAAPLALTEADGELQLTDTAGRSRWRVPWGDVGVAWQREAQLVEVATATGEEAQLRFTSQQEASDAVAFIRERARERRAYPLALESDSMRLWRVALAWIVPSAVATLFVAAAPEVFWPAVPIVLALGTLGGRGTRRVSFGADGVIVEGRFRRRHVPFRDIVAVESKQSAIGWWSVALRRADGRRVAVGARLSMERAALTRALLEEGLRMVERGEEAGAGSGALAPDGRDAKAWLEAAKRAGRRGDYRDAPLDVERLVSIVRNPAADAAQRVAAALALRAEPAGIARIRVAAEVSTEPNVREALEVLGSEDELDEERVERVLRRLGA